LTPDLKPALKPEDFPYQIDFFTAAARSGEFPPHVQEWFRVKARSRGISTAPAQLLPSEGLDYWCADWLQRCVEHMDAFVIIAGAVGRGKSTLSLELARKCDPTFLPNLATRMVYDPAALLAALETIQPGQVIIYDEVVNGLANVDSGFQKETKLLLKCFAMSRFKSAIVLVVAPSIHQIHLQIRGSRATHWIECLDRGLALVHVKYEGIAYRSNSDLVGYSRSERAPYMIWQKIPEKSPLWINYESVKEQNFDAFLKAARTSLQKKGGRTKTSTERVRKWWQRQKDT
jgi:hypothetical protein